MTEPVQGHQHDLPPDNSGCAVALGAIVIAAAIIAWRLAWR